MTLVCRIAARTQAQAVHLERVSPKYRRDIVGIALALSPKQNTIIL